MPQDTIFSETDPGEYHLPTNADSLNREVKLLTQQLYKEQEFQRRSEAYSKWAPVYTVLLLSIIWIIIRLKYGKKSKAVENDTGRENETG